MKDFIKINHAIDEKNVKQSHQNIAAMQAAGAFPMQYTYPVMLQFELTGQCNLACKHCYNRSGDKDRETLMTPDKWCELSRQIVKDGGIFQCILSGGEPLLLGDRLFDIMDILHDDGTSFVLITNGLLLTHEKAQRFKKYRFFWFQISIDGSTAEIHDAFRGVKGSFEHAVHGALEISQAGLPLVIAHSVTPQSLPHVEDMVELAYQLGANSITLGEILPSGRAVKNTNVILTREQRNELYGRIQELSQKYHGKIIINRAAGMKAQLERYQGEINSGGIIRPNGNFRLDCMAPFTIGNVLETPLQELWRTKAIDAWKSPLVQQYIDSLTIDNESGLIRNHVDQDIAL